MEIISLEETVVGDRDIEPTLQNSSNYLSDIVKVTILPEKKGNPLWKHIEYEIKSEKHKSRVERRFNDFVNLYQNFLSKYEFRMIVRIPPKQFMLDTFVEERRANLQRWLFLVSQHPLLSKDEMFKIFITDTSENYQEMINNVVIENDVISSKNLSYEIVKKKQESARKLLNQILKIKRFLTQHFKREIEITEDFLTLSKSLSTLVQESSDNNLKDFSENYKKIHDDFDKASRENSQSNVIERIDLIIEIFSAFCDLTERTDESFRSEKTPSQWQRLQKAIKANNYDISDTDARDMRTNFAVHCILEEYNFAMKYLKLLPSIMLKFTHEQSGVFANIAKILNEIVEIESDKLSA